MISPQKILRDTGCSRQMPSDRCRDITAILGTVLLVGFPGCSNKDNKVTSDDVVEWSLHQDRHIVMVRMKISKLYCWDGANRCLHRIKLIAPDGSRFPALTTRFPSHLKSLSSPRFPLALDYDNRHSGFDRTRILNAKREGEVTAIVRAVEVMKASAESVEDWPDTWPLVFLLARLECEGEHDLIEPEKLYTGPLRGFQLQVGDQPPIPLDDAKCVQRKSR